MERKDKEYRELSKIYSDRYYCIMDENSDLTPKTKLEFLGKLRDDINSEMQTLYLSDLENMIEVTLARDDGDIRSLGDNLKATVVSINHEQREALYLLQRKIEESYNDILAEYSNFELGIIKSRLK